MPRKLKMPAFLSKLSSRTIWIIVGVVVLAGAGGFAYYKMVYLPAQTPS